MDNNGNDKGSSGRYICGFVLTIHGKVVEQETVVFDDISYLYEKTSYKSVFYRVVAPEGGDNS